MLLLTLRLWRRTCFCAYVALWCRREGETPGSIGSTAGCSTAMCLFFSFESKTNGRSNGDSFCFSGMKTGATRGGDLPACLDIRMEINQSWWKQPRLEEQEGDGAKAHFHITQLELRWWMATAAGDSWLWNTSANCMILLRISCHRIRTQKTRVRTQDDLWSHAAQHSLP